MSDLKKKLESKIKSLKATRQSLEKIKVEQAIQGIVKLKASSKKVKGDLAETPDD
jgi:hypothetical protein